ncbi:hypothetical protein J8273_6577 [Carpediemonas membranifera]|uniref:Uncharacterized protein n=1 Tax=Carpediemonas membranifera TaxID=201153 RepID=A0A8J6AR49_9EUKA|nr:hypothetical protein J8273_6577 [Carpediemonas membranifera]|eukprot:KAG9391798.1 hypothetical protein J8273_6577 [Carpediemonas membranifera]
MGKSKGKGSRQIEKKAVEAKRKKAQQLNRQNAKAVLKGAKGKSGASTEKVPPPPPGSPPAASTTVTKPAPPIKSESGVKPCRSCGTVDPKRCPDGTYCIRCWAKVIKGDTCVVCGKAVYFRAPSNQAMEVSVVNLDVYRCHSCNLLCHVECFKPKNMNPKRRKTCPVCMGKAEIYPFPFSTKLPKVYVEAIVAQQKFARDQQRQAELQAKQQAKRQTDKAAPSVKTVTRHVQTTTPVAPAPAAPANTTVATPTSGTWGRPVKVNGSWTGQSLEHFARTPREAHVMQLMSRVVAEDADRVMLSVASHIVKLRSAAETVGQVSGEGESELYHVTRDIVVTAATEIQKRCAELLGHIEQIVSGD